MNSGLLNGALSLFPPSGTESELSSSTEAVEDSTGIIVYEV